MKELISHQESERTKNVFVNIYAVIVGFSIPKRNSDRASHKYSISISVTDASFENVFASNIVSINWLFLIIIIIAIAVFNIIIYMYFLYSFFYYYCFYF